MFRKKIVRSSFVAVASVAMVMSSVVAANADTASPLNCGYSRDIIITSNSTNFVPAGGQSYENGPGGSVSVTTTSTESKTGTTTGSVTADVNVAFGKVSGTVSQAWANTSTLATGTTFSHDISAGKYGTITPGFYEHTVFWDVQTTTISCGTTTEAGGKLVYYNVGSNYSER